MQTYTKDVIQKLSHREQILLRPDSVIGSVESTEQDWYIWDSTKSKMVEKTLCFPEGLLQIFDEILVNAADNKQRDSSGTTHADIRVSTSDRLINTISVFNNGKVLPTGLHSTLKVPIPELAFGSLLTSENYNDNIKRTTGGRNGYGSKVANIFSNFFEVTITEKSSDKKKASVYKQTWRNNMAQCEKPILQLVPTRSRSPLLYGTSVTFSPDNNRFCTGNKFYTKDDILAAIQRRVWDFAATTGLKTTFNRMPVPVKNFKQYVQLYAKENESSVFIFDKCARWQVALRLSTSGFEHVSFVNNIFTSRGGTHVKTVMSILENFMIKELQRRRNGHENKVTPKFVREHCMVFVNCFIENPAFDTQTKTCLTLHPSKFGSVFSFKDHVAALKKQCILPT